MRYRELAFFILSIATPSLCTGDFVLVSSFPGDRVLQYSASTGEFEREVIPSNAGLNGPGGMVIHPIRKTLLVTNFYSNSVMEFDLQSGAKLNEFGSLQLNLPIDIKIHPVRNTLLVSGRDNRAVLEFDLCTNAFLGTFATGPFSYTFGIDFDRHRNRMLVANWNFGSGSLLEFDLTTGAYLRAIGHGIVEPTDVFVHPETGVILADTNHAILQIDPVSGRIAGTFASHQSFNYPSVLEWNDLTGELLVANRGIAQNVTRFNGQNGGFNGVFIPRGSGGLGGPSEMLFVSIPEPTSFMLLTAAICLCITRRKRDKHSKYWVA